ncbi:MAG TPA: SDR family oxidoreductase [Candidatus Dormibacteraeota bacterium]|nr:SDR family oxidoreductase [Candidatus Dormibacteraeota bacterium]
MRQLQDKVALVTGASRGLGRAVAIAFAREGARVAICARGEADLDDAAAACRALGADVLAIPADVAEPADRERLVARTLDRFGRVDVLVNNASTLGPTPLPLLADTDPEAFEEVLRVNLAAPFLLARALVGGMLLRGSGLIVNVSSDAAVNGYPGWGAYSAAKAGLDAVSRVWAAEASEFGVTVVSVDPGDMDTEMHRAAVPDDDPAALARPEDVAEAFVRLVAAGAAPPRLEAGDLLRVAR